MSTEIRHSGIAVVGNVPWGTHFCQFYQTKTDLIESLVPYFQAGLENNEFCMWITADNLTAAEAHKAMAKAIKGFSAYVKKGQIEILPYTEWYLQDNSFNKQRVLDGWVEKLKQALEKGFNGLRLTGNTFWLEKKDWGSFTEYEEAINNVIGKYNMIALCTYSLEKCSAAEIVDVIRNHEFALIKQEGKWEIFENSRYNTLKENLIESEKRFRLALKNVPVTVAAQDSSFHFLWAYNQRTRHPEEVVGKTDFDIFSPQDAERLANLKRKVLETGKELHEQMWITSNGKTLYLDLFIEPVVDKTGKISGVEIATVDLTSQKLVEDALKESEEKFRVIAETSPIHISISRLSDGTILYLNRAYSEAFGYKLQDLIGTKGVNIYYAPEDRKALVDKLNQQGFIQNHELKVKKADGTPFWISVSIKPLDYNGEPAMMAASIDITERRNTENAIIRLNRELRAIRECDQAIVYAADEKTLLNDICRILCLTAGYRLAWIGEVLHDEGKSVKPLFWCGDETYISGMRITWADTEKGRGPTGSAIRTGKTHFFQDFNTEPLAAPWREAALSRGYVSSIALPLKNENNRVFAVLSLYGSEPNVFTADEIKLLEELAGDLTFGISALREKARRQQAEIKLAHLASFPELNPNPVIELGVDGKITYLNPAAETQIPDLFKLGMEHPFLANGWEVAQKLRNDSSLVITREVSADESWWEQTLKFVVSTNTYRIYAKNITERKLAEDILKESEERNRLILATTLDGVWINDLSGRLLYVNDAYCHMIGYKREELLKMYIHDIEAREKPDETREHINKIVRRGGDVFETRHKCKDGSIIDLEISARYTGNGNGQLVAFVRDITARKRAEVALKASEERFGKAFHSSPVALSISRISDGTFIDLNPSFLHLFGYARDEVVGQNTTKFAIYNNISDRNEIMRLLQEDGRVVNFEAAARTKTGNEIKVLTSAERIEINGQEHIIWTTIDVTEREQAEDLLRETSNYLSNLLDYANAPIIVWDTHFRISRFNPAFERLTGHKSQDVIGLQLDILFPENKKLESMQQIGRTLSGERWEVVEIPILRVDGEMRTVLWNSANVYDNDGKNIIATIAQGQDITERKQVENALKTSETQYRRLFEAAKDGILLLDADTGLILDVNPFLIEMLGLRYEDFIGKNLWELGFFKDIVASKANFFELQKNKYVRYEDLPLRSNDGKEMKVEFVSNLYDVDEHHKIIQCNIRDITRRKQAEEEINKLNEITKRRASELEVANKELEAFAYSVSHDLHAPLRSMEGFSQALLEDCYDALNDECKDYLRRIQSSAELMARLIDDMLRLSRLTRSDMIMSDVNLTETAQAISRQFKSEEPARKVKFIIAPDITARGDEKLLAILLENLFGNAWKFTGKTPEAHIEFGTIEQDGQKVYFVRDNGVGFNMTYADKLFKPFQRLHTIAEFPGTGIGLASVQRIVQRHGGQVWAESKVGEGATFYFTLGL